MGANGKAINMVLLGRTGNGKSATGNSILARKAFESKNSLSLVTKECKLESCVTNNVIHTQESSVTKDCQILTKDTLESSVTKDSQILNVIDTPGLFDTGADLSSITKEIVRCVQLAKDGLHAVLYVVAIDRLTPEEYDGIYILQTLFGPKLVDYMVVVFTGGDKLEADSMTLEEYLKDSPKELKDLLHKCYQRKVLFNNRTTQNEKKEEQRILLLTQIEDMITKNGGQPYSNTTLHYYQNKYATVSGQKEEANAYKQEAEAIKKSGESVEMLEDNTEAIKTAVKRLEENTKLQAEAIKTAVEKLEENTEAIKTAVKTLEENTKLQAEAIKTAVEMLEKKIKVQVEANKR